MYLKTGAIIATFEKIRGQKSYFSYARGSKEHISLNMRVTFAFFLIGSQNCNILKLKSQFSKELTQLNETPHNPSNVILKPCPCQASW